MGGEFPTTRLISCCLEIGDGMLRSASTGGHLNEIAFDHDKEF